MRIRALVSILVLACLSVTGCAAGSSSTNSPQTANTAVAPTPTPTATPSPTPTAVAEALVVSVDGLSLVTSNGTALQSVPFSDGAAVLELMTQLFGTVPAATPDPRYNIVIYKWDAVSMSLLSGSTASVSFTKPESNGLKLRTTEGLGTGASAAEALALGAQDAGGNNGDGTTGLRLDAREVAGTKSLAHPDRVGIEFVYLVIKGGIVVGIQSPGNDFSDL